MSTSSFGVQNSTMITLVSHQSHVCTYESNAYSNGLSVA